MGWRSRRDARDGTLAGVAAERLDRLARQWRPTAVDESPGVRPQAIDPGATASAWDAVLSGDPARPEILADLGPADPDPRASPLDRPGRSLLGPWTASALRGLILLVMAGLLLSGWWWWSGRPRAVAVAPTVIATGMPVAGARASASPTAPTAAAPARASPPATTTGTDVPEPAAAVVVTDPAAPGPPPLVVHVSGLVADPGLVTLPPGARVADAIDAAGGVTRRRASDSVNLARVLVDGEQIVVGLAPVAAAPAAATPSGTSPGVPFTPTVTDLNTATTAQLEQLPGVGPVLAGRIVQWRTANGPFRSVEELGEVSGIGDAILGQIRPLVRV